MKSNKSFFLLAILSIFVSFFFTACSKEDPQAKANRLATEAQAKEAEKTKTSEGLHALTAEEIIRARDSAIAYFGNAAWPVRHKDKTTGEFIDEAKPGVFDNCRPTDSNHNGKVSCTGRTPKYEGGFELITRYCGYNGQIIGCSDRDD